MEFNLTNIRQMSLEIEAMMHRRAKEIETKSELDNSIEHDEGLSPQMDALIEDYHNYANEWPFLFRESLLLSLCSFYEHHLMDFSDRIAGATGSSFRVRDLKDRGLTGCRKLLLKCGIGESTFKEADFDRLTDLYRFRNRVAHAGGRHDGETLKRIKGYDNFFIHPDHPKYPNAQKSILVKASAVDETCKLMESSFQIVGDACVEHLRLRKY